MKGTDKAEGATWLQQFWLLRDEIGPIVRGVSQAEKSGSLEDKSTALSEALAKLPDILRRMKRVPKPRPKELRAVKKLEERALHAYIKSCGWRMKQLGEPGKARYSAMAFQNSLAASYWEISEKQAAEFLRE